MMPGGPCNFSAEASQPSMPPAEQECKNLLDVAPLFIALLEREEWKSLRATCHEARAIADRSATCIIVDHYKQHATPTCAEDLTAFVRGMLSRGARPDAFIMHPWAFRAEEDEGALAAATTLGILAILADHLQQQPHPQQPPSSSSAWRGLTHLSLCNVPYTDALASAVHSAAPHLASLDINSDLSPPDDLDAALPGLCRLITTCAPSLTSLTFSRAQYAIPQPLADAIATCTCLQHLQVELYTERDIPEGETPTEDSAMRVVEVARALPSLRSLDLYVGNEAEPPLEALGTLTQLTSLKLNVSNVGLGLAVSMLRPLHSLARLALVGGKVAEADLGVLAAECGQLTHLAFEDTQLGLESAQAGRRGCVRLPAALRELHLGCSVDPRDLLALQLPPGLTRLRVDCIKASALTHTDAEAGAGVNAGGVPAVPPSACPGFDELLQAVGLLYGRFDGSHNLYLSYEREPSPRSWPVEAGDGHVRLFAALRPLRLRRLVLMHCAVGLRDVAALAEQLPELQELTTHGELHPAAVPLLARLPRLRHLELQLPLGHGTDTWSSSGTAVAAAIAPLLMGATSLKRLTISPRSDERYDFVQGRYTTCSQPAGRRLVTTLWEGVEWVKEQLRGMGREPGVVEIAGTWRSLWDQE